MCLCVKVWVFVFVGLMCMHVLMYVSSQCFFCACVCNFLYVASKSV